MAADVGKVTSTNGGVQRGAYTVAPFVGGLLAHIVGPRAVYGLQVVGFSFGMDAMAMAQRQTVLPTMQSHVRSPCERCLLGSLPNLRLFCDVHDSLIEASSELFTMSAKM